jgi:hypothetical protein
VENPASGELESARIAVLAKTGMASIERRNMRIFLAGVSCVGKTTVGARLAGCLECRFLDLDVEIERFFGTSMSVFETVTRRRTISVAWQLKP